MKSTKSKPPLTGRYAMDFRVSMFAYSQEDAEHLAALIRDRIDGLLGGGQALVSTQEVRPVREGEDVMGEAR